LPKYGMLESSATASMAIILLWCTQWRICWHSNTKYCHLIYMIFLVCFVTYFIIMIQCCDVPFSGNIPDCRNCSKCFENEREREREGPTGASTYENKFNDK
jgi:hypothetical protein